MSPLIARAERPTILWFRSDFAPASIVSGPDKDGGYLDRLTTVINRHLPEYNHPWVTAPVMRIHEEMKTRPNVCNPAFLKTPEREAFFVFSDAYVDLLPNGLIVARNNLDRLAPFMTREGAVQLAALLDSQTWRVAIVAGRSYGRGIDAVLRNKTRSQLVVLLQSADLFSTGLRKLAEHRDLDAVVGYSSELAYAVLRGQSHAPDTFVFVPITEELPLIPCFIACSRSPEGVAFIARVNEVLAMPGVREEILSAYRSWLSPDALGYYDRARADMARKR